MKYIGSTICELKKCILEHIRATINHDRSNAIAKHMETTHQSDWKLLKFYGLEIVTLNERGGDRTKKLRQRESKQIINFRTMTPWGLNQSEELYTNL